MSLFTSGGLGLKNLVLFTPQLAVGVEPVTAVSSPAVVHCLLSHTQPPLLLSTSPRRLRFRLYLFVSQRGDSESCWWILMKFLKGVGCVASNKHFGDNSDHYYYYRGILREFLLLYDMGIYTKFADKPRSCRWMFVKFLTSGMSLTSSRPVHFGSNPDHDPNVRILDGTFWFLS